MKTHFKLKSRCRLELPPEFEGEDVRFPLPLVEYIMEKYTKPGDIVFDPFAGFGSVLTGAESMDRLGFGMESDLRRVEYARKHLNHPERILHGDSLDIASFDLPRFDFVLTSPPYMKSTDTINPLRKRTCESCYQEYLDDLKTIFGKMRRMLAADGKVVIEAGNIKHDYKVTALAWDIASSVSEVLDYEGELVACWDKCCYGYDHTYCLVFSV
jgi:DNA modification methylase